MKLANMMGGNTCSDIVPGRTNMDVEKTRQQEQKKLEQRIKEESGEVKKRKATPIEYLLLFGKVPRLDQVQVMKPENLNREDARRLLDAGCSKCHLMRLYGIQNPGGPHYKQLAEILREQQPASNNCSTFQSALILDSLSLIASAIISFLSSSDRLSTILTASLS